MITFGLFDVIVVVVDDDGGVSSALKLRVSALDAYVEVVSSREEEVTAAAIDSFILFVLWFMISLPIEIIEWGGDLRRLRTSNFCFDFYSHEMALQLLSKHSRARDRSWFMVLLFLSMSHQTIAISNRG